MATARPVPPSLRSGPFRRADVQDLVSDDVLQGPAYRRLFRGVYTVAGEANHGVMMQGARLALGDDAVLAGMSALWAHGCPLAGPDDPVEVIVPRHARSRPGLRVRSGRVLPREVVETAWGRTTSPARTAFDLARGADVAGAVACLDALARATGLKRSAVDAVAADHPGVRGVRAVARALDLVNARAESPRESRLRVVLALAGLPAPAVQYVVHDAEGMFVARCDLAWPDLRVAVEYDGGHHDDPQQMARDRARSNALKAAGWTVLAIDRSQFARPAHVVAMVSAVLRAASVAMGRLPAF